MGAAEAAPFLCPRVGKNAAALRGRRLSNESFHRRDRDIATNHFAFERERSAGTGWSVKRHRCAARKLDSFGANFGKFGLEESLVSEPEGAVVFHHADGIGAFGDFGQAIPLEAGFIEPGQEAAPRIIFDEEVAHMDLENPLFDHVEIGVEPGAGEVGIVRVPAGADIGVAGGVENGFDIGEEGGFGAVDFEPDLDAVVLAEGAVGISADPQ